MPAKPNNKFKVNTAGGSPAAITNDLPSVVCWVSQMASSFISHFFLLRQRKSNQRKGDPGLPPLRGSLDQSQASGAAQLDLAGRTPRAPLRDSNSARLNLRFLASDRGGAQGMKSEKQNQKKVGTMCPPFAIIHD